MKVGKFLGIFILLLTSEFCQAEDIWLLIDTQKLQLEIKRGNKTIKVLSNIAIGRNGAGVKQKRGDDVTPLGEYKIAWINKHSPYYRFYGFDYPSVKDASLALQKGLINEKVYKKIIESHRNQQIPPQYTSLGGQIGIHGLGKADIHIHRFMNWTHGCIALTNKQIDLLSHWIKKGTVVKVR